MTLRVRAPEFIAVPASRFRSKRRWGEAEVDHREDVMFNYSNFSVPMFAPLQNVILQL